MSNFRPVSFSLSSLLRRTSASLASKCSTILISWSLIPSACLKVLYLTFRKQLAAVAKMMLREQLEWTTFSNLSRWFHHYTHLFVIHWHNADKHISQNGDRFTFIAILFTSLQRNPCFTVQVLLLLIHCFQYYFSTTVCKTNSYCYILYFYSWCTLLSHHWLNHWWWKYCEALINVTVPVANVQKVLWWWACGVRLLSITLYFLLNCHAMWKSTSPENCSPWFLLNINMNFCKWLIYRCLFK